MFQPHSPGRRRESTPLLEKIRSDNSLTKIKLSVGADKKEDNSSNSAKIQKEQMPMLKYLASQV